MSAFCDIVTRHLSYQKRIRRGDRKQSDGGKMSSTFLLLNNNIWLLGTDPICTIKQQTY